MQDEGTAKASALRTRNVWESHILFKGSALRSMLKGKCLRRVPCWWLPLNKSVTAGYFNSSGNSDFLCGWVSENAHLVTTTLTLPTVLHPNRFLSFLSPNSDLYNLYLVLPTLLHFVIHLSLSQDWKHFKGRSSVVTSEPQHLAHGKTVNEINV